MFALPGRLASPGLQRPGAFFNYVNDICTELCDTIQSNVSRVYQEFNYSSMRRQHSAAAAYELRHLVRKQRKLTIPNTEV